MDRLQDIVVFWGEQCGNLVSTERGGKPKKVAELYTLIAIEVTREPVLLGPAKVGGDDKKIAEVHVAV